MKDRDFNKFLDLELRSLQKKFEKIGYEIIILTEMKKGVDSIKVFSLQ